MIRNLLTSITILFMLFSAGTQSKLFSESELASPESHFGFKPGSDRNLFDYKQLISYLKKLEKQSPRMKLLEIGRSPMNKPIYIAFISSEQNIQHLDKLKEINRKLALDWQLPESEKKKYIRDGKVFVYATMSMHSSEVGPSQSVPLLAHDLLTTADPRKQGWMENVVLMVVPCHNPDGMDMVVKFYRKHKGTKYEGAYMPGVYHKYVGHDNNRDFVALTQSDTKAIARVYNLDWFPQVMVEKHQMGTTGVRYFVPPNHDPIAENVDEGLWNWSGIFGANMMKDMTAKQLAGVSQRYLFDEYWPGSTGTCLWKNVITFLTEAASVKTATPVYVEANELNVYGKGLSEYKKSINMPLPWKGGWWRLGDIVQYELTSLLSVIKTASLHRTDILKFRHAICVKEANRGKSEPPFYYILPRKQHDAGELVNLVNLLIEHGVQVNRLSTSVQIKDRLFEKGDIVVSLAQPFRPFVKEVMEKQRFPVRHYTPGGKIIKPYDITSWSLPLHMGVQSLEINSKEGLPGDFDSKLDKVDGKISLRQPNTGTPAYDMILFPVSRNESFRAAFKLLRQGKAVYRLTETRKMGRRYLKKGSFITYNKADDVLKELNVDPLFLSKSESGIDRLKIREIKMPQIGLIETDFHDMDAGWTRFIFDQYHIPFEIIKPHQLGTRKLTSFDVIILPDNSKHLLKTGKYFYQGQYYSRNVPPQYIRGMGSIGLKRLLRFLDDGGIIVSWRRSTQLFSGELKIDHGKGKKESFRLPFTDISDSLQKAGLYCPGSFIRVNIKQDHPVTFGIPAQIGIFSRGAPIFRTSVPSFGMDRRALAVIPEKDILLSGYVEHPEKLANRTVATWIRKNKGQIILLGFNPQFRASTQVTYKLLFNSLLLNRQVK